VGEDANFGGPDTRFARVRATTWGAARLADPITTACTTTTTSTTSSRVHPGVYEHVLLSVLMLSVKPSVGLRSGVVDLSAFVKELLICRPSCRPSSCRLWKPPHAEEVLPKFSTFHYNLDFYLVHVQFLFIQRHSGASSNHVGGSLGSHVGASPAGASSGSQLP
jgi:hypothetical protein